MSKLSERMRAARIFTREVEGWKLKLLRPVFEDLRELIKEYGEDKKSEFELACRHTVGWEGVKETDFIRGGSSSVIDYDADAWREYLSDHSEVWSQISTILWDEYQKKAEKEDKEVKN